MLITFILFWLIRSLQTNRADMDKVLVRMRQFRLHGNCGLGCNWPFASVDQFGCFDCVAVFLRLQMKTTEYSHLPNSKFGDSPTTSPLGWRTVVPLQPHIVVFPHCKCWYSRLPHCKLGRTGGGDISLKKQKNKTIDYLKIILYFCIVF